MLAIQLTLNFSNLIIAALVLCRVLAGFMSRFQTRKRDLYFPLTELLFYFNTDHWKLFLIFCETKYVSGEVRKTSGTQTDLPSLTQQNTDKY